MITAIEIENFKCFGQRVRLELKPLTLLFGANSSGKSSILQALLYAYEVFIDGNCNPTETRLGGDLVNLGGFHNFVHRQGSKSRVQLRFEFACTTPPGDLDSNAFLAEGGDLDLFSFIVFALNRCSTASVEIEIAKGPNGVAVIRYEVGLDGRTVARLRVNSDWTGVLLDLLDLDHPLFALTTRDRDDEMLAEFDTGDDVAAEQQNLVSAGESRQGGESLDLKALRPAHMRTEGPIMTSWSLGHGAEYSLRDIFEAVPQQGIALHWGPSALPRWERKPQFKVESSKFDGNAVSEALSRIIVGPGKLLRWELNRLRYLGAFRQRPERGAARSGQPGPTQRNSGELVWHALATASKGQLARVNHWLRRLDIGYSVLRDEWRDVRVFSTGDDIGATVAEGPSEPIRYGVVLVPDKEAIRLSPHDVGTGVSQVLPVVVFARLPRSLVCIEQPELHLHPALQTRLGDLFIESALTEPMNRFILETHSEHLILRLLRRIRETTNDELPPGASALRPDQIAVIYVEQTADGVRLSRLRVDETGEFIDRWPHGFFEEREDELF